MQTSTPLGKKILPQSWCTGSWGQVQRLNREAKSVVNTFSKECEELETLWVRLLVSCDDESRIFHSP